jgi:hypothetical protein
VAQSAMAQKVPFRLVHVESYHWRSICASVRARKRNSMRHIYLIMLFFYSSISLAQDSAKVVFHNYRPQGAVRIIGGVSGVYGIRYGGSVTFIDNWSIEIALGRNKDYNLGGGDYDMYLTGFAINRCFPLQRSMAIIASILFSHAKVIQTSYEYKGDFNIISPMVGVDYSLKSGFCSFARVGIKFISKNYREGSGTIAIDVGICWQFKIFSAP